MPKRSQRKRLLSYNPLAVAVGDFTALVRVVDVLLDVGMAGRVVGEWMLMPDEDAVRVAGRAEQQHSHVKVDHRLSLAHSSRQSASHQRRPSGSGSAQ